MPQPPHTCIPASVGAVRSGAMRSALRIWAVRGESKLPLLGWLGLMGFYFLLCGCFAQCLLSPYVSPTEEEEPTPSKEEEEP